jgi:hypothetical protein
VFGGTKGNAERAEYDEHYISLAGGTSAAMLAHQSNKRKASLNPLSDAKKTNRCT